MKRTLITLALILLSGTILSYGAVPAKTELTASGSFVNFKEGGTAWQLGAEMAFPLTSGGQLLLGPSFVMVSEDELTRAGAVLEWNLMGQKHGGLFIGGSWLYFVKDREGERDTATARAGVKFPIGKSGLLKIYAEQVVSGVGKDEVDLNGALALGVKF